MQPILDLVSIAAIMELPWYVGMTGLAAALLLAWSGLWSLLTLRPIRAVKRVLLAFVILIILSQGGEAIVQLIGAGSGPETR